VTEKIQAPYNGKGINFTINNSHRLQVSSVQILTSEMKQKREKRLKTGQETSSVY